MGKLTQLPIARATGVQPAAAVVQTQAVRPGGVRRRPGVAAGVASILCADRQQTVDRLQRCVRPARSGGDLLALSLEVN